MRGPRHNISLNYNDTQLSICFRTLPTRRNTQQAGDPVKACSLHVFGGRRTAHGAGAAHPLVAPPQRPSQAPSAHPAPV
jgi:hypothetical protein